MPPIVRVEQALVDQAGLDETGGERKSQHGGPATAGAPSGLSDEQGGCSVERTEDQQSEDQLPWPANDVVVAQQVLSADRRQEEQAEHGQHASAKRDS